MRRYATVQQVRQAMNSIASSADDDLIERLIESASQQIDDYCNRPDGFVAPETGAAREYVGRGAQHLYIDEHPVAPSLVEIKFGIGQAYAAIDASDYRSFSGSEREPDFNRTPFWALMLTGGAVSRWPVIRANTYEQAFRAQTTFGNYHLDALPSVRVTARWGYAIEVPATVVQATVINVVRLYKRGQSAYSDVLSSSDFGTLSVRSIDPYVEAILKAGRLIRARI